MKSADGESGRLKSQRRRASGLFSKPPSCSRNTLNQVFIADTHIMEHPITGVIDRLHRSQAGQRSIPRLLTSLFRIYGELDPESRRTESIWSLDATPGCLVDFRCEVRSVVQTRVPAYLDHFNGTDDSLLLFRRDVDRDYAEENLRVVEALSLGCVIRDPIYRTHFPVIVELFDEWRDIREGQEIFVIGILASMPALAELLTRRRSDHRVVRLEMDALLNHNESQPRPEGICRVQALFHDPGPIPDSARFADGEEMASSQNSWCVLI